MPRPSEPTPLPASTTLPTRFVVALCVVYLLAGAIGHDPWKTNDAIHLGVIHSFLVDGDWLIPKVAGEPWAGTAPLYHWTGASLAWLLQAILPLHDAARLATTLFGGIVLVALVGTTRILHGREASAMAPLLAIGTLGFIVPLHDAHPVAALIACQALAYWGLALMLTRPLVGGTLVGLGLGFGVLASGIAAIALIVPLLLVMGSQHWRKPKPWLGLALALFAATLLGIAWPLALFASNDSHLATWWANELALVVPRHPTGTTSDLLELFGWSAWPAWPLAAWAIWLYRRRLAEPEILLPLTGTITGLAWLVTHEAQAQHALPTLLPLILLATAGAGRLRRGAANAFNWFAMMTFTLVVGLIWLGAIAMLIGVPSQIAHNFAKLAPGFVAGVSLPALTVALLATAAWVAALARLPRSPLRAVTHWSIGLSVSWVLLMTVWLPWIDYGKSYRGVALSLKSALPANANCVARSGLGLPQRASLDYFAGIRTLGVRKGGSQCKLLLVQGPTQQEARRGWIKLWEGSRPGDKHERWRLYQRQ